MTEGLPAAVTLPPINVASPPGPSSASTEPEPPDWSTIPDTADVGCPKCGYSLRGLTAPRCPECGYGFDWPAVLSGAAEEHPYLFDVHRRRPLRALVETFVTGFQPSRFWSSVPLELRPVPRRLVLYWLILAALPTAALFTLGVQRVGSKMWNRPAERLQLLQRVTASNSWIRSGSPSAQALVDQVYPPIWSRKFNRETRDRVRYEGEGQLNALCVTLAWPWLTLSALMLFRWSMRRARVRPAHVLRCCVYACDWAVLVPIVLVAFVGRGVVREWTNVAPSAALPIFAATIIGAVTTYRLGVAYRTYLRFDRPFLTALAAQLIVVAFVWVVCLV